LISLGSFPSFFKFEIFEAGGFQIIAIFSEGLSRLEEGLTHARTVVSYEIQAECTVFQNGDERQKLNSLDIYRRRKATAIVMPRVSTRGEFTQSLIILDSSILSELTN
jgi:hypothetical protein